jgi:SNF2 family DNA or RNA helicase
MSFTKRRKRGRFSLKKFVPKSYQSRCIKFGVSRPAAGFFLAPGLGKTIITLIIFRILKRLGIVDELLVVAKRRIIYEVWPAEIAKWKKTAHFRVSIVHGAKKEKALWAKADVRLINYEGLEWLKTQKKWFRRGKRVMLVCDESSKLRHTRTIRYKSLKKILPRFDRRYILTGSPAPNGLMGLFGQAYVLDFGDALGKFVTHFRNEYFYPSGFMGHDWKLLPGAEKRLFKKLKPLVIRFGEDQLDLPPLTYVYRKVTLPDKVMAEYKKLEKEFILEYQEGEIVAANAAVASGKLRQIANGGVFYTPSDPIAEPGAYPAQAKKKWRTMHEAKCEELVELLEELNGEPALVAFEFKHDKERIVRYFKRHARQFKNAQFVDSGMKDAELAKIKRRWDKGEVPVLFGHPDSIAHGLNMQGKGGIVIFFSMTWNLENYEQFIRRVWRQGQKRRVIVYHIIARGTVDELMRRALKSKDKTQQALLKAMEDRYGVRKTKTSKGKARRKARRRKRRKYG